MEDAIKAFLGRCAQFTKAHYCIVQSLEFLVASLSFLSMIPCLFVIAKTGTLHWNCKLLLLCSASAQLQIIAVQMATVIFEFHTGDHLPDDIGNDEWFMFMHEVGYGISTVVSAYLVVERFVALSNVANYSETVASWRSIVIIALLTISLIIPWAYYSDIARHFYIGIAIIMSIELPVITFSFVLYVYSKRKYREMNEKPLSVRYQMAEILEYARAVIPVVVCSSVVKSCSLITCIFWQEGYGQYGFLRVVFFTIHTLNCVVMKTLLIAKHRGLRRTFWIYFYKSDGRCDNRTLPKEATINAQTETYFRYFKTMWD